MRTGEVQTLLPLEVTLDHWRTGSAMQATKQLLILDVDETLVYAHDTPLSDATPDFRLGSYVVYRRPFLSEFLTTVNEWFDLAVWSSASPSYVEGVVAKVFGDAFSLRFVWSRQRCTRRFDPACQDHFYAKNLVKVRKLGYPLERMLIVDDSPEKVSQNYGNYIRIRPFTGNPADTELRDLLPFLRWLSRLDNVRAVEKRHWRLFKPSQAPAR